MDVGNPYSRSRFIRLIKFIRRSLSKLVTMEDDIPRYAVIDFAFGDTSDAQLTVIFRTKRFYITLSAQNLQEPDYTESSKYEREYLQLLSAIQSEDHTDVNPEEPDLLEAITH